MHVGNFLKGTVFLTLCTLVYLRVDAQVCVDDYFSITYNTSTVQTPIGNVLTPQNEILISGHVMRPSSILLGGWLTKISLQGTLLWSRYYASPDYNYIKFNKAIPVADEGYLVIGNIGNVDTSVVPPAILTQMGFLLKVNKQGTILWSKMFGKVFVPEKTTDITDIIETDNGEYIITVNHVGQNNSNILARIDREGNLKWTTSLTSPNLQAGFGNMRLKRLKNGDLIAANTLTLFNNNLLKPPKQGYYIIYVNEQSGLRVWDRTILNTDTNSTRFKSFGDVVNITELPNNDLSFIASYADTPYLYFHNTTKVVNLITDDIGRLKKVHSYRGTVPTLYASAAVTSGVNGDQAILMDNADAPLLMSINADGQLKWQRSYSATGRSQETRTMLATPQGFYFLSFTHNGGSKDLNLVKTDLQGNAPCVETPLTLVTNDITPSFKEQQVNFPEDQTAARWYSVAALSMADYSLDAAVKCRKSCCTEVIQHAGKTDLCNTSSYTLPNKDVVNSSGVYTVIYKTQKGCDSIVYYDVNFSKDPIVNLGPDECLENKDSIVLKTAAGYGSYTWMDSPGTSASYTVKQPGTYWISVTNGCGTIKDSIKIYDKCEFDIYMPNAFTPNGDYTNDHFRIPSLNKNKLIRFTIYNRYGQLIFETSDIKKGWDGTYNNKLQSSGTYIYHLTMETLNHKRKVQKGAFLLIR